MRINELINRARYDKIRIVTDFHSNLYMKLRSEYVQSLSIGIIITKTGSPPEIVKFNATVLKRNCSLIEFI